MTPKKQSDWRTELFAEETLWEVFRLSPSVFQGKFAIITLVTTIVALIGMIVAIEVARGLGRISWSEVSILVVRFADLGFDFSIGVLGFLITGFAVFSALTNPELFWILAQQKHERYEALSHLKFIFFTFINTFVHFIWYAVLCWTTTVLFQQCGVIFRACEASTSQPTSIILAYISYVFLFGISIYTCIVFLKLKSFIWNLYQSVLISIAFSHELRNQSRSENAKDP